MFDPEYASRVPIPCRLKVVYKISPPLNLASRDKQLTKNEKIMAWKMKIADLIESTPSPQEESAPVIEEVKAAETEVAASDVAADISKDDEEKDDLADDWEAADAWDEEKEEEDKKPIETTTKEVAVEKGI